MKKYVFLVLIFTRIVAFGDTKFGAGASFGEAVPMSEIMKKPDSFIGKQVTVSGVIMDVCAKRGCWMQLTTDVKNEKVRVKVNDGEMMFPLEARGKKAAAKGLFKKINLTLEQSKMYLKEQADDNKVKFDPNSVKEAVVIYQVQAVGAVIEGK